LSLEGLGKRYTLGASRQPYETLGETLSRIVKAPARWLRGSRRARPEDFWALRDVTLRIDRGEVVGVIGRNGAGKSTLLKILSNIVEPTEGVVRVWGSVGSLLEVGTGFHPELTGRENIYLNGAILGMPRSEIARRYDEIVAFAGVEKFLDTQAKHYSSGMYMRLAFSVAAHLETDNLLVDEVLAVGDADFQKKCLGKMEEVASRGRTVVFVSHSMPTVLRLCQRVILLEGGQVADQGTPHQVVAAYLRRGGTVGGAERIWRERESAPGDAVARLHAVRVRSKAGVSDEIDIREAIEIDVEFWNDAHDVRPSVNLHFYNDEGAVLFVSNDFNAPDWKSTTRKRGLVRSTCRIPGNFLAEGRVTVLVAVSSYNPTQVHALERDAVAFHIIDHSDGDGVRGPYGGEWPGVVRPMLDWRLEDEVSPSPDA
jgi:lipopolysaccharide transport system ATP-binding protein